MRAAALALAATLLGCDGRGSGDDGDDDDAVADASVADAHQLSWVEGPPLPQPMVGAAVGALDDGAAGCDVYVVLEGAAYRLRLGEPAWNPLPAPPAPRPGAAGVGFRDRFWLIGGGGDGDATTRIDVYDPTMNAWGDAPAPLPLAVSDAAVVVWRGRFLLVIGGRDGGVPQRHVQIWDDLKDLWKPGTAFDGVPVYDHAAAIVGDAVVVLDGLGVAGGAPAPVNQVWLGDMTLEELYSILWSDLAGHDGPARAAAAGAPGAPTADLLFVGGLNEVTMKPIPEALPVSLRVGLLRPQPAPAAAHHGLVRCGDTLVLVGGLDADGAPSVQVWLGR